MQGKSNSAAPAKGAHVTCWEVLFALALPKAARSKSACTASSNSLYWQMTAPLSIIATTQSNDDPPAWLLHCSIHAMPAQETASPTLRSGVGVQGSTFGEICGMTDKFEGCVVREMRRLDELMKNLHLAAKVIRAATGYLQVSPFVHVSEDAWCMHV